MSGERYEIRFQAAARRAIAERLPESVAAAVLEFCEAALAVSPRRVGKPLFGPLAGCHAARRGTYRIVYRIDEQAHAVQVLDIDHRADIYHRPLRLWGAKVCPEPHRCAGYPNRSPILSGSRTSMSADGTGSAVPSTSIDMPPDQHG